MITGPNTNGLFLAHKLAEIVVQVYDQADNSSLQVRQKFIFLFQIIIIIIFFFQRINEK